MVNEISSLAEWEQVLEQAPTYVLVDFTAEWCGPCRMIKPIFEKLSAENSDILFLKVDVDKASDVAKKYKVSAMPTFILFKNGEPVTTIVGADPNKLGAVVQGANNDQY